MEPVYGDLPEKMYQDLVENNETFLGRWPGFTGEEPRSDKARIKDLLTSLGVDWIVESDVPRWGPKDGERVDRIGPFRAVCDCCGCCARFGAYFEVTVE